MKDKIKARRTERYCGNATPEELQVLLEIAISKDNRCGNDIYYSIVTGVSYDEMYNFNRIPTSKSNFYHLKYKTLEEFEKYLDENCTKSNGNNVTIES